MVGHPMGPGGIQDLLDEPARIADIKAKALADVGAIAEDAAEAILTELTGKDVSREDVANAVRESR